MDTSSLTVKERRSKGRHRAVHTNSGRFMYVQADYRNGRHTPEEEQRYERVCYDLHCLWKAAR